MEDLFMFMLKEILKIVSKLLVEFLFDKIKKVCICKYTPQTLILSSLLLYNEFFYISMYYDRIFLIRSVER